MCQSHRQSLMLFTLVEVALTLRSVPGGCSREGFTCSGGFGLNQRRLYTVQPALWPNEMQLSLIFFHIYKTSLKTKISFAKKKYVIFFFFFFFFTKKKMKKNLMGT